MSTPAPKAIIRPIVRSFSNTAKVISAPRSSETPPISPQNAASSISLPPFCFARFPLPPNLTRPAPVVCPVRLPPIFGLANRAGNGGLPFQPSIVEGDSRGKPTLLVTLPRRGVLLLQLVPYPQARSDR